MTTVRVHRPDLPRGTVSPLELAPRGDLGSDARLMIIDNRKPGGRVLLEAIAEHVQLELPVVHVEVHSKPSAGAPLDADVTRMLAARSRLVITGLGD